MILDRITRVFELVFYVVTSAGIISGVRSWLSQVKGKICPPCVCPESITMKLRARSSRASATTPTGGDSDA